MIKKTCCILIFGQLLAAQFSFASPEASVKEAFNRYYGDSVRLSSLYIHERMLAPFEDCDSMTSVMTPGRQRMSRPRIEMTCHSTGLSRRVMAKAEGSFKAISPTRDVRRGRVLMGRDLKERWMDFSHHRSDVLLDKSSAYGRIVKIPLREGRPLRDSQLSPKYDIFSGQIAELIVNRQGMYFSIPVEALESGISGDRIDVKNTSSGKSFTAIITKEGSLTLENTQ